jgi:hypothetical protein
MRQPAPGLRTIPGADPAALSSAALLLLRTACLVPDLAWLWAARLAVVPVPLWAASFAVELVRLWVASLVAVLVLLRAASFAVELVRPWVASHAAEPASVWAANWKRPATGRLVGRKQAGSPVQVRLRPDRSTSVRPARDPQAR